MLLRVGTIALLSGVLSAATRAQAWTEFVSAEGRFAVKMPGSPTLKRQEVTLETDRPRAKGRRERAEPEGEPEKAAAYYAQASEKGINYAVYYHDRGRIPASQVDRFFKSHTEGTVRNHRGSLRSEKPITVAGKPGRELVIDTTVDGVGAYILRARIILAGDRLYQVFASAPEMIADSPAIAVFFDSFRILESAEAPVAADTAWVPFTSDEAGFSALFPTEPKSSAQSADGQEVKVLAARENDIRYVVTYTDYPAQAARVPKQILDGTRASTLRTEKGVLLAEKRVALGQNPGREWTMGVPVADDPKGGVLRSRAYLVGRRVYQLIAVIPKGKEKDPGIARFFDSFKLQPKRS